MNNAKRRLGYRLARYAGENMNIDEFIINEDATVLEAMWRLDTVARTVLFVAEDKRLLAALTDGDIRRWILKGGDLNADIQAVANYSPKYLIESNKQEALQYMKKHFIEALPILRKDKTILSIILWNDIEFIEHREQLNIPVVIMAGGLGKRLYPYTNILPKPLIPIGEIPITEHIINQFCKFGCNKFYFIVNHKKNMIKAYFNEIEKDYDIFYVDENTPLGTGGGLALLKGKMDSTFILTNCDILIEEDFGKIYKLHKEQKHVITVICSLKKISIPYGVIEIGEDGNIASMKEKPELSFFTNTGCYLVEPRVIEELEVDTPINFPEIIERYRSKGEKVGVYPIGEEAWMDMGQADELERMQRKLRKGHTIS